MSLHPRVGTDNPKPEAIEAMKRGIDFRAIRLAFSTPEPIPAEAMRLMGSTDRKASVGDIGFFGVIVGRVAK